LSYQDFPHIIITYNLFFVKKNSKFFGIFFTQTIKPSNRQIIKPSNRQKSNNPTL